MFIEVTRVGGQSELLNADNIVKIRDRSGDKPTVVMMVDGSDFEVSEAYEDLQGVLSAP